MMTVSKLALLGGPPVVPQDQRPVEWPVITGSEQEAVLRVLRSGKFVSNADGELEVKALEKEWADFIGARYCIACGTGTAALIVALAALGVGPGDEVIVPALSFIASALAPLHQLAVPVFVDVDPRTFNIDPALIEEKITPRTRAIMVVHLHGLPADMREINALAAKHGLHVVEDAAQSHGAKYDGRYTGTLGEIAAFSLHVQKNLPTCGEGGLITTQSRELYEKCDMLRQFGEVLKPGEERLYLSQALAGNHKLNAIQAAFTRSQLAVFAEYQAARDRNVPRFLAALAELPGVLCPVVPPDRTHAWHILRLRFDPAAAGLDGVAAGPFRKALRRALRAEGVPASQYQVVPLPGQHVFQAREGFGRGYPWTIGGHEYRYRIEDYPNSMAVIEDSLTLQRRHLNPSSGPLLDLYAEALHKIWQNLDVIGRMARALPYEPPWRQVQAGGGGGGADGP
jgi:dTDP-4-amino-4,6-dideoxygalactose transaminase